MPSPEKKSITKGVGRVHKTNSGSLSVYIQKTVADKVTLPLKQELLVLWDDENRTLTIKEL